MTHDEARLLTLALSAAPFHGPTWDEATTEIVRTELEELDYLPAHEAVQNLIRSEEWRPSVAQVLGEYRERRRAMLDARPALHEPAPSPAQRADNLRRIRELTANLGRAS